MDIELKLLRSFVAIHERRSLSRAAEALAITQAAMSMRLRSLEQALGGRLFERRSHGIEPTARADDLYGAAIGVLAAYDEMMSGMRVSTRRPRLRLGAPDDYALGLIGPALGADPPVDVEIVCDLSAGLAAAIRHGDLDLALVTLTHPPTGVRAAYHAPLAWIGAPGLKPPGDGPVAIAAYPEGCVFRAAMVAALESAGRSWRVAVQSRSHAGVMAAVRAGRAVTAMAAGTAPADLVAVSAGALPPLAAAPIHLIAPARPPTRAAEVLETRLRAALAARYPKAA